MVNLGPTEAYVPRLGDIGLVRMQGGVGRAIRFGQWLNGDGFADLEHAFVCVGGGRIIEAMPGGALNSPLSRYDGQGAVYLRCPHQYRAAVTRGARELEGTPYSFLDYGALALHRFRIPAPRLKRYIQTGRHEICSQLADHAALLGGWHLFSDNRWEGDVTPADLANLYSEQPYAHS